MRFYFMKVGKRDAQVLLSIQKYCDEIRETMRFFGDNEEAFMNSYVYRNACAMPMQTIGELVKSFSDGFLAQSEEIPWKLIRDMRNIFVHAYHQNINFTIVWETMQNDIPMLREFCAGVLKENNYELVQVKSLR